MKRCAAIIVALVMLTVPAVGEPVGPDSDLTSLPHADVARLLGSWEVQGFPAGAKMTYEFLADKMAMHGSNPGAKVKFELTMDADYRLAGKDAIWIIATNPRPVPEGLEDGAPKKPSINGIQFMGDDRVILVVSSDERFTLLRVH